MEGNSKMYVFLVVGIVVGAAIGIGAGYMMFNNDSNSSAAEDYNFYLYFGEANDNNDWYSASADNATAAFDKAMKAAGIEYTVSSWGYISSIGDVDSGWYISQYLYSVYNDDASAGSIASAVKDYGCLTYSNGWKSISGFDDSGSSDLKLYQFDANTYFLSPYQADYSAVSPTDVYSAWSASGPFA